MEESTATTLDESTATTLQGTASTGVGESDAPARAGWRARLAAELRSRPAAYIVMGSFMVAGPLVTAWIFPDAPTGAGLVGGIAFGAYAALCAVPQKFL